MAQIYDDDFRVSIVSQMAILLEIFPIKMVIMSDTNTNIVYNYIIWARVASGGQFIG